MPSFAHTAKFGMPFNHDWRRCRSCSRSLQSHQEISHGESPGDSQKRFVEICQNVGCEFEKFLLVGWLWLVQCKPFAFRPGKELHPQSGRTSQTGNISDRIFATLKEIQCAIRRAVFVGLRIIGLPFQGAHRLFDLFPRALPSATMGAALSARNCSAASISV